MTRRRTLSIIANITGAVMDMDKAGASIAPMLSDHRPRCRVSDARKQISFLRILRREFARSGRLATATRTGTLLHDHQFRNANCTWVRAGRALLRNVSAVNFPPVSNAINADDPLGISNFIDHTIVADANPPIVLTPGKLAATWRPRIP